jgi:penicillin-binding protein 2
MLNKNKKERSFARRTLFLGGLKGLLFLILSTRLYYLQIVKSNKYRTYSDSNRIRLSLIPPFRGKILDRNEQILATNKNYYRILFDKAVSVSSESVITKLGNLLQLSAQEQQTMLNKIKQSRKHQPIKLKEHLSWKQVSRIEAHAPELPGITIDVAQIRDFTTGATSAHIVGYLGPVSEKEIEHNPLLNHPDFKIGRNGIEKTHETTLRGTVGVKRLEVNAFGLTVNELSREEGTPGKDLILTLDKDLQEYVGKRLDGQSGCVIVLDTHTGAILSSVSTPSFNPNAFTYGVDTAYWNELMSNPDKPMINKALSSQYPPGSTFKLIVALAALKDGIDPKEQFYCPGSYQLGRRRFHCWKKQGHGNVNLEQAIMHSCNTYFYNISKKLGVDKIAAMAHEFGLGKAIDIGLPDERSGLIPTSEWKQKRFNIPWQTGDTLNTGIGQGFVLTTPLQLAALTARVATGKMVMPHIIPQEQATPNKDIAIPEAHLDLVRKGMFDVVNTKGGTAYWNRVRHKDFQMAGKTGTSQVISKQKLEENFDQLTDEEKRRTENHALFVGYAPFNKPRYAISVVIEHGGGGSKAAAPVARDIMQFIYKQEQEDKS